MQKLPVRQAKPGILSIKTYPQNVDNSIGIMGKTHDFTIIKKCKKTSKLRFF